MRKFLLFLVVLVAAWFVWFYMRKNDSKNDIPTAEVTPSNVAQSIAPIELPTAKTIPSYFKLDVPYISEAPSENWTGPWKNACEEASIAMVDFYYKNKSSVSINEAEAYMNALFDFQNKIYGNNVNADAERLIKIIREKTSFSGTIARSPTIEQIKNEILAGNPVISLHYGFDLKNSNIPFLASGTSYHMMVIVGFDDNSREFIVNDDGDTKEGANHRYDYDLFMSSLHDFDFSVNKASGLPTAVFTGKK